MDGLVALLSFGPDGWGDELAAGAWLTIRMAVATLPVGLALGFSVALAKQSRSRLLRIFGELFTTVFRGLPELLTLFIIFYGGQIVFQAVVSLFTDATVEANSFLSGMAALGVVFGAYAAEAFAAAFKAIPRGQWEGAAGLGLTGLQALGLVILPQLIRLVLPALANLWLVLLKDTALIAVLALDDLLRMSDVAAHVTKQPFLFYSVACLIYLLFSIVSTVGIQAIERWAARGDGRIERAAGPR